jgi:hypothetical protein
MISPIRSINQQILAATGTVTPAYDPFVNLIKLTTSGNVPLSASFALVLTNYEVSPIYIPVYFDGDVTLGAFAFTIAGATISQDLVNQKGVFHCFYDGTAWTVFYNPDFRDKPQEQEGVETVVVPNGGGTLTLVAGVSKQTQRLVGTTTLSSNYTVTASTTGVKDGTEIDVLIEGGITLNGNTMTVFGQSITAFDALNGGAKVSAVYDEANTTWRSTYVNRPVSVDALANVSALSVLANPTNASAAPTVIVLAANQVITRVGNALVAQTISPAMLRAGGIAAFVPKSFNVENAQLLDIFSTPVEFEAAQGATFTLDIASIKGRVNYATAAFATSTDLFIRYVGATNPIAGAGGILAATGTQTVTFAPLEGDVIENAGLEIYAVTNNPTAGGGTLTLFYDLDVKFEAAP